MKKLVSILLATVYLASFGAMAADDHKCKAGEKWDSKTEKCVKVDKK